MFILVKKILFFLFFFILIFPFFVFANNSLKNETIKILLVPGHDNEIWGAQYGNIKEADMNLVLATKIFNLLKKDKKFKVWITRDNLGYTTEFVDYFSLKRTEINSFKDTAKEKMEIKINDGGFIKKISVPHNNASKENAFRLYGINKWANENKIDAIIHIHFNDYPRNNKWTIGKHKGFAIYVPDEQRINSKESIKLGEKIFLQIDKKYISSTYEKELGGFIKDQNLIALGSNDTLSENVRSILIEYGYIYRFGNNTMRHKFYKNMSNLTVKGIREHFKDKI